MPDDGPSRAAAARATLRRSVEQYRTARRLYRKSGRVALALPPLLAATRSLGQAFAEHEGIDTDDPAAMVERLAAENDRVGLYGVPLHRLPARLARLAAEPAEAIEAEPARRQLEEVLERLPDAYVDGWRRMGPDSGPAAGGLAGRLRWLFAPGALAPILVALVAMIGVGGATVYLHRVALGYGGGPDDAAAARAGDFPAGGVAVADGDEPIRGALGTYAGIALDGRGVLVTRLDRAIDFDWGSGPPVDGMQADRFTVEWRALLEVDQPDLYRFFLESDDGARLWVGGELVIDKWGMDAPYEASRDVSIEASPVPIRVEFYEFGGSASIHLTWSGPDHERQPLGDRLQSPAWTGLPWQQAEPGSSGLSDLR